MAVDIVAMKFMLGLIYDCRTDLYPVNDRKGTSSLKNHNSPYTSP